MDQIEHILRRSEIYVGSKNIKTIEEYVAVKDEDTYKIMKKEIEYTPALLRIFIECLSNALDNVERSKKTETKCTKIMITINEESGETIIWNDGDVVPIEINDEGMYNHSMIFGQLLTGSNYNDDEERLLSGVNGLGAKACNVMSTTFSVYGVDPVNGKSLRQTWTNNMRVTSGPVVKDCKLKKGFTEIKYVPDFNLFGLKCYSENMINLYTRYIIDAALLSGVKVYFNDELIKTRNLLQYSSLYAKISDEVLCISLPTSELVIMPSDEYQAISFVNGVYTRLGGQHVDAWTEAIFRPLLTKLNKKGKPQLNIKDIKQFFRVFVKATVDRPEFNNQEKEKLELPKCEVVVKQSDINKISKWSVYDQINDIIRGKEMVILKKSEKKRGYVKVEGLDPANLAGGKFSSECTLILCEGLSAKTYAVAGIQKGVYGKSGRDYFGIFPLRGVLLNTRNANPTTISKNREITGLIKALNLKYGVDYTIEKNYQELNYGKIMIICDADDDGIHISSLILNFFHSLFPTLLEREQPFVVSMQTPIVRVIQKHKDLLFYDEKKFKEFASKQTAKFDKKYYKGLGTTKSEDVPDTFGVKMIEFEIDENTATNMDKVFHKKNADDRKVWLTNYEPNNYVSLDDEDSIVNMTLSDYIDGQLIKFSISDCKRSIPCFIDGLKSSQRKILYAVKKKNLKYNVKKSVKVAQLGGYIAENTNYHHGEQNLYETIVKMANEFPGSNNIPLFYRDGQFGSRLQGGKDAANARYIYTKMDMLTHLIFREEDDVLLEHEIDDGDVVEPKFYVPIIPMLFVNGVNCAIGSGWSCSLPNYNPLDLINCIKLWIKNGHKSFNVDVESNTIVTLLPELIPWYRDFHGKIERFSTNKFITKGIVTEDEKGNKVITELPIGLWTDKFKESMEDLIEQKQIKKMKNYSTPKKVNFILSESSDGMKINEETLKLHSYLHTSNMVLFTADEKLKKYDQVDEIIDDFCKIRYQYYIKRKEYILNQLKIEIKYLQNKERFIREVMAKDDDSIYLNIMNIQEDEIIRELEKRCYDKKMIETTNSLDALEEDNITTIKNGFNYLLTMQIRTFTAQKIKKLNDDITSKIAEFKRITDISEDDMWIKELEEFILVYNDFLKDI